jgi:hypothetical protein
MVMVESQEKSGVPTDPSRRNCPWTNQCIITYAINVHQYLAQLILCENSEVLRHFFLMLGWQHGLWRHQQSCTATTIFVDDEHANHPKWTYQVQKETSPSPGMPWVSSGRAE